MWLQLRKGDEKARELEELMEGSGHFVHLEKKQKIYKQSKGGVYSIWVKSLSRISKRKLWWMLGIGRCDGAE